MYTYVSLKLTKDNRISNSIVFVSISTFSVLLVYTAIGFIGTFVGCLISLKSTIGFFDDVVHVLVMLCEDLNNR